MAASLWILAVLPAAAQTPADPRNEPLVRIGVRAGAVAMGNEAFETVYGSTLPLFGADASLAPGRRWSVRLSGEAGRSDGELFIPAPDPAPQDFGIEFETVVAHLTVLRAFPFARRWNVRGGIGASYVNWREEAEFDSASGSGAGAHAVVELVYRRSAWEVGPALMYWIAPEALPDSGLGGALNERALGGIQLSITGAWRFGER